MRYQQSRRAVAFSTAAIELSVALLELGQLLRVGHHHVLEGDADQILPVGLVVRRLVRERVLQHIPVWSIALQDGRLLDE